ncbi:hypothetical protein [Clostridium sp.]|uniref:hypothetical protein n=1 Tax=Clostridium sp. TaxID=1506 RepID=UPI00290B53C2|nr:hypothetical protein [Clostridium sp.]MDU4846120.1 hypothetical protein [Clostridium sp.]
MKNLLKEAHKLTKEIKNKYPEVNYMAQLGVCISYLNNKEEVEMVELKGTEKQIDWAKKLREDVLNKFDEKLDLILNGAYGDVRNTLVRNKKMFKNTVKKADDARVEYANLLKEVKAVIENQEEAKFFIETRHYNVEEMVENYYDLESYGHYFFK